MFPQRAGSRSQRSCTGAPVLHKTVSQRRARRTAAETSKYVTVTRTYKQHHMTVHSSERENIYVQIRTGGAVRGRACPAAGVLCGSDPAPLPRSDTLPAPQSSSRQHSVNKVLRNFSITSESREHSPVSPTAKTARLIMS